MEFNLEVLIFFISTGTALWAKQFQEGFCGMMYCDYKIAHLDILYRQAYYEVKYLSVNTECASI